MQAIRQVVEGQRHRFFSSISNSRFYSPEFFQRLCDLSRGVYSLTRFDHSTRAQCYGYTARYTSEPTVYIQEEDISDRDVMLFSAVEQPSMDFRAAAAVAYHHYNPHHLASCAGPPANPCHTNVMDYFHSCKSKSLFF